jgi:hypothetical protein
MRLEFSPVVIQKAEAQLLAGEPGEFSKLLR